MSVVLTLPFFIWFLLGVITWSYVLEWGTFSNFCGKYFLLDPAHELGIITFLKLASELDGILIYVNIIYTFALRYESVHVPLVLKGELCLLGCVTNEGLHVWLLKFIGSFALCLCQSFLRSQVSLDLMGYKPFFIISMLGYMLNLWILGMVIK